MSTHEYPKEMIDPGADAPVAPTVGSGYTFSPQLGKPGRCFAAQVWDGEGKSVAGFDATDDPSIATVRAAALASLLNEGAPVALTWLPIETAPQDGRTILLGRYNELGKWRTMRGQWMSQDYIDNNWEDPPSGEPGWFETCVEADEIPNCWPINPTHWTPLPGAPEAA